MIRDISAAVLFVDDLDKSVAFYRDTLGFQVMVTDDVSAAFKVGELDFVVLQVNAAIEMIDAASIGWNQGGTRRVLLCAGVDDIDAAYAALTAKGIAFIKPPIDQAWGRRTAYFADPEGNLWELWQAIAN